MKKSMNYLFAGLVLAGGMTFVSCSNDEDIAAQEQTAQQAEEQQQMTVQEALDQVSQNLSQVDFKELDPLIATLNNKESLNARAMKQDGKARFLEKLRNMLQSLRPAQEWNGFDRQWSFANTDSTLMLAFEALVELDGITEEGDEGFLNRAYAQQLEVMGANDTLYTISTKVAKSTSGNLMASNVDRERELYIYKDGQLILGIDLQQQLNLGWKKNSDVEKWIVTGQITYQNNVFTLGFSLNGDNTTTRRLSYVKDAKQQIGLALTTSSNLDWKNFLTNNVCYTTNFTVDLMGMFKVSGKVNDVKKFYLNALNLVIMSKYPAKEELCKKATDTFNENTSILLTVGKTDMGSLSLATSLSDSVNVKYSPVIIAVSPIFGNEPKTFGEVLDLLGISIDDIMKMIMGKKGEDADDDEIEG